MTEIVIAAMIAAIPPTIIGVLNFIQSRNNSKKIKEVHKTVNGGLSRLPDDANKAGNLEGRIEQNNERREK